MASQERLQTVKFSNDLLKYFCIVLFNIVDPGLIACSEMPGVRKIIAEGEKIGVMFHRVHYRPEGYIKGAWLRLLQGPLGLLRPLSSG